MIVVWVFLKLMWVVACGATNSLLVLVRLKRNVPTGSPVWRGGLRHL